MVLFTLNVSKSYRILFAQRGWTRLLKACLCRFELISFEKAASCAVRMLHWTLPLSPLTPCKSCYDEVYVHFLLSIPRQCVLRSINSPVSTGDGVEEGRNSLQPLQLGSFAFFCPAFRMCAAYLATYQND